MKQEKEQLDFNKFKEYVASVLIFRNDWDNSEWNLSYIIFKDNIHYWSNEYLERKTTKEIVQDWAVDFYQDATPYTHDYWVNKEFFNQ